MYVVYVYHRVVYIYIYIVFIYDVYLEQPQVHR